MALWLRQIIYCDDIISLRQATYEWSFQVDHLKVVRLKFEYCVAFMHKSK